MTVATTPSPTNVSLLARSSTCTVAVAAFCGLAPSGTPTFIGLVPARAIRPAAVSVNATVACVAAGQVTSAGT